MTSVRGVQRVAGTEPGTFDHPQGNGLLERAAELAVLSERLAAVAADGSGHLVLIAGEAGIGKTALVRRFCAGLGSTRVLSGACDALHTPRPLGPLLDIAEQTGGELAETVDQGTGPSDVLAVLGRELRRRRPTVVVLEDLHWADDATLDLLRLLGRRVQALPALILATYRDDELDRSHALRMVLGELPRADVTRVAPAALSLAAVADLAAEHGVDAEQLHRSTAGNPFYVTEALAAGHDIPGSVRDAVLARAARLPPEPRMLLDAVAVVPRHAELWLLEAVAGEELTNLERCLASGMLRAERDRVAFRHEIARMVVEQALPPDRAVTLHRRALRALAARDGERGDLARLAHHAEAAGDADAVLRHAPAAGERAAAVGAHREAAAQFDRALRFAERLGHEARATLLEQLSYERYLIDSPAEALVARQAALTEHRAAGDQLREADTHRWLSRLAWFTGDNATAYDEGRRAIDLLQRLPPGPELAMAYSNMAQLRMLADDWAGTQRWGERAIELAQRLGAVEILIHALNNVGTAELAQDLPGAEEKLLRSLALAHDAGLDEHVARAHTNLGASGIVNHRYELGERHLQAGIGYCRDRDLDSWRLYMVGWEARAHLEQGRWDAAAASAAEVLDIPGVAAASRITPLVVIGRLRARRGDPEVWPALDEAAELARGTGELQRLAPVAVARAEARWLVGQAEEVAAETEDTLALATERRQPWATGELCVWRRRAGLVEPSPAPTAEPFQLELAGDAEGAAQAWTRLGCPYEAALALASSSQEASLRLSLDALQALGARPAAARVARALRERGARDLRHGPRAATLENPAGLTARELEVLELLAEGLRNTQIADCLVVSRKTVDHHVSAILRKLDAGTRTEAVAAAVRLGMLEH